MLEIIQQHLLVRMLCGYAKLEILSITYGIHAPCSQLANWSQCRPLSKLSSIISNLKRLKNMLYGPGRAGSFICLGKSDEILASDTASSPRSLDLKSGDTFSYSWIKRSVAEIGFTSYYYPQ